MLRQIVDLLWTRSTYRLTCFKIDFLLKDPIGVDFETL